MRFVVDAQLPFTLATFLRRMGHNAIHTSDLPNKNFSEDKEIISYAIDNNAVIISKDSDFLNSFILTGNPNKLILVRTGNINNKALIMLFENHFNLILSAIERSSVLELTPNEIIELY